MIAFETGATGILYVLRNGAEDGDRDGVCRVRHLDCNDGPGKASGRIPVGGDRRRASFRDRFIFRHAEAGDRVSASVALPDAIRMDLQDALADQACSEREGKLKIRIRV